MMTEEVAKVFGVPFQVVPFKADPKGGTKAAAKRHHVYAIPARARFAIRFPRVEGYQQAIRNRVTLNWAEVPPLWLDPVNIPGVGPDKFASWTRKMRDGLEVITAGDDVDLIVNATRSR